MKPFRLLLDTGLRSASRAQIRIWEMIFASKRNPPLTPPRRGTGLARPLPDRQFPSSEGVGVGFPVLDYLAF